MPEYTTFLNAENMAEFWDMVKWFLFFVAPVIMLFFATDAIGLLIRVIRSAVGLENEDKNNDDDDYDIYRY